MIRVNLLPIKEARQRRASFWQLVTFGGVLVLELVVCGVLYTSKQGDLESVQEDVQQTQAKVKELEKQVEEAKKYKKRKKQLEDKLSVLDRIQKKAGGPVEVLEELQSILTPPANPEQRYKQRQKGWNVEWDPRNLWIQSLVESGGNFDMDGRAQSADDVAEFLHRLETAPHFEGVQLDYVRPTSDGPGGAEVVTFHVTGKMKYGDVDKNGDDDGGS